MVMDQINLCNYPIDRFWEISSVCNPIIVKEFNYSIFYVTLFHATNEQRNKHNLPLLMYSGILKNSAILHSNEMKEHNFFHHENKFNIKYRTLYDRVFTGLGDRKFLLIGENIADYPLIANRVILNIPLNSYKINSYKSLAIKIVQGWMNSPGHRANILNKQFNFVGFGCALHKKMQHGVEFDYVLCTQNFGGV